MVWKIIKVCYYKNDGEPTRQIEKEFNKGKWWVIEQILDSSGWRVGWVLRELEQQWRQWSNEHECFLENSENKNDNSEFSMYSVNHPRSNRWFHCIFSSYHQWCCPPLLWSQWLYDFHHESLLGLKKTEC